MQIGGAIYISFTVSIDGDKHQGTLPYRESPVI